MWKFLDIFYKDPSSTIPLKVFDESTSYNNLCDVPQAFNDYFMSVVPDLLFNRFGNVCLGFDFNDIFDRNITHHFSFNFLNCFPYNVVCAFTSCKSSSVDFDYLSKPVFQFYPHFFACFIAYFINQSFFNSFFPSSLKIAKIVPVYKKGDPRRISNYRPIFILPLVSKVFEKIAFDQMYSYLAKNHLLNDCQFGFSKNNGCESALQYLLHCVIDSINKKYICIAIFLDYSKAFDTLSHLILCNKLKEKFYFSNPTVS